MIYNDPFVERWWSWMDFSWFLKHLATLSPFPLCKGLIQQKLCGHRTWPMVFEWHLMTTDMSGEELLQILERESSDASLGLYFERHKTHKVGLSWESWRDIDESYDMEVLEGPLALCETSLPTEFSLGGFPHPKFSRGKTRLGCRECRCSFGMEGA